MAKKAAEHMRLVFEGDAITVKGTRKKRHIRELPTGNESWLVDGATETEVIASLDSQGVIASGPAPKRSKKR